MSPVKPDLPVTIYIEMIALEQQSTVFTNLSKLAWEKQVQYSYFALRTKEEDKKNARNSRSLLKTVQMCSMSMIDWLRIPTGDHHRQIPGFSVRQSVSISSYLEG